jgi:hypothetical protein
MPPASRDGSNFFCSRARNLQFGNRGYRSCMSCLYLQKIGNSDQQLGSEYISDFCYEIMFRTWNDLTILSAQAHMTHHDFYECRIHNVEVQSYARELPFVLQKDAHFLD